MISLWGKLLSKVHLLNLDIYKLMQKYCQLFSNHPSILRKIVWIVITFCFTLCQPSSTQDKKNIRLDLPKMTLNFWVKKSMIMTKCFSETKKFCEIRNVSIRRSFLIKDKETADFHEYCKQTSHLSYVVPIKFRYLAWENVYQILAWENELTFYYISPRWKD